MCDGQQVKIGTMVVEGFEVPHEGTECLGYRVGYKEHWAGVITDLGVVTDEVLNKMRTLSIMAFEFNHDEHMLINGSYPFSVKERILDWSGHLSNRQAAEALEHAVSPRLQHLILAHISEQLIVLSWPRIWLVEFGITQQDLVSLHVANQSGPSPIFSIHKDPISKIPMAML